MPWRGLYRVKYGLSYGDSCSILSQDQCSERITPGPEGQALHQPQPCTVARALSLKFPVPEFYTEDPDFWFWQLEAVFQVNRVPTEKDKYAVVVSHLLFKVVRLILRTIASRQEPYTILMELVVKETDLSDYQRSEKLHTQPELWEIPVPYRRFTEANINIVEPLPPSTGFSYLLTMIDRNIRWLEVTELDDITASTMVSGFLRTGQSPRLYLMT